MSMLRTVVTRTSVLRPRLATSSNVFMARSKDSIKDREDALETEYVRMKEKEDLKKFKEKMDKEKEENEKKQKKAEKKDSKDKEIDQVEKQIKDLQEKLESLKKKK
ncbi:hypothetical protein PPL_04086 [Heterostelium album PN500]|uniref:Uncharacterized protein n=1 Tax=Heterostelium pallidum (strain ATCC 26659 / Pp 5 / PN500) TaxID=670386 RepID=D3B5Z8_HETP5|nr:hypothetical protein PPL_04086 [Heterostelium album PN500]EFA83296.1 hypothetical protein PPL_04086 [Heterostelium album PN500]|eukprot:XP_020435413.1 hypothetical protein PPL_04086 [Heterostelium album PN500]